MLNNLNSAAASLSIETENTPTQGVFARFENKYFVPVKNIGVLKEEILKHMLPAYPQAGTEFTGVESVYFDSDDFQIYRMHFSHEPSRYKIRTRRYAPDGIFENDTVHLELKSKENGVSRKTRFEICSEDNKLLWNGGPLVAPSKSLTALNPSLTEASLCERVTKINELISQKSLRPSFIIRYQRQAFENGAVRLTIDDQINSHVIQACSKLNPIFHADPALSTQALQMHSLFRSEDLQLVEVKHPGVVPAWLTESLVRCGSQKAKFSKYCYSVTQAILNDGYLKVGWAL